MWHDLSQSWPNQIAGRSNEIDYQQPCQVELSGTMVDEISRSDALGGASADNTPAATASDETRLIRSADLFAGQRVVLIEHAGSQYRLMITRNDRLILQK